MVHPNRHLFVALLAISLAACGGGAQTESQPDPNPNPNPNPAPDPDVSITGDNSANEGDASAAVLFTVSLSAASSQTVTVELQTSDGSAVAGEDYEAIDTSIDINPGITSVEVAVEVIDDNLDEADETLSLGIVSATGANITTGTATGTIIDDDESPSVSIADISVQEGSGGGQTTFQVPVSLSQASQQQVSVSFATNDATATAGVDYQTASGEIVFSPGETAATIAVAVEADSTYELDESFSVVLSAASNAAIGRASATATILNDDNEPQLSITDANAAEGSGSPNILQFVVSRAGETEVETTVDFATIDGTAVASRDYLAASGSLTIAVGESSATVLVETIPDTIDEVDTAFTVTLSNPSDATLADASAVGMIVDDDGAPSLIVNTASISEGDDGTSTLTFSVSLSNVSSNTITADYATADGTAEAGVDYQSASGQLTIAAGSLETTVEVTVIGDLLDESDETVVLNLSNPSNAALAAGSVTGTIIDDDGPPSLTVNSPSIDEGNSGTATLIFEVTLSAASSNDVTVDYATVDGTAESGSDYQATSGQLSIPAGSTSGEIVVTVLGDTVDENDETVELNLSNPANATLVANSLTGTIIDDDGQPSITVSSPTVAEGNSGTTILTFDVSLSGASSNEVTVDYATADGTALAGSDYEAASGQLSIPAGAESGSIDVTVLGDVVDEGDETVVLNLSNAVNAAIGTPSVTGTISDDDNAPTVTANAASIVEGDSGTRTITFDVALSAPSSNEVTVNYATADGTASAGADFEPASGQLSIPAGSTSGSIDVSVIGDTIDEINETFDLVLSGASNATLGSARVAGTINDDDGPPTVSISDASISEGDSGTSALSFAVTASAESGKTITVDYQTIDGSAIAGEDYQQASGSVFITPGSTTGSINIQVIGDTDDEPDETFQVSLTSSANSTIADSSATGTIADDDDAAPVTGLASRPSNTSCVAPDRPSNNSAISVENAFPDLPAFAQPVSLLQAPGDSSQWYVVEQAGRILTFANNAGVTTTSTFIDIRNPTDPIDVDSSAYESGMFGIAFHPDYGNGNFDVFLSYMIDGTGTGSRYRTVIARMQSTDDGQTLDTDTLEVMLEFGQPYNNHNGGHLEFGPDGYLYIHFGDGGSAGDPGDRSQNTTNLFGTIIRIDVDSGSPYAIPSDNPFAPNARCSDGDGADACPEIYAWGLRNTWKFSFDAETGNLWAADVGQDAYEEVNLIELGGNYGWRCREASSIYNPSGICPDDLTDPVIEYSHTEGRSITGGYAYRGSAIAGLAGRYIFADFGVGKIFGSVAENNGGYDYEVLLDTNHSISAFAREANGELLYFDYVGGDIYRIVNNGSTGTNTIPDSLRDTGCVDLANPTLAADGMIPYAVNAPFWSDGADKQRWYGIPDGTTIDVDASGDWLFPIGTVLMKNFRINGELFETRLFMRHTDGEWAGYTYEWNGAGTDATRVVGGKTKTVQGQDWIYPSGSQCMECHTSVANFSLGLEHGQQNGDLLYTETGITANQLLTAEAIGMFTDALSDDVDNLPRYTDPADTGADLESRARAYLHSNCAGCHRPLGPTPSGMDLRHSTSFGATQTCNEVPSGGDLGIPGARLIVPGNADASLVYQRANRRDVHAMPPVGSNYVDTDGVAMLRSWINSLGSCP